MFNKFLQVVSFTLIIIAIQSITPSLAGDNCPTKNPCKTLCKDSYNNAYPNSTCDLKNGCDMLS